MILILSLSILLVYSSALPNGNRGGALDTSFIDTIAASIRKHKDNADTQNVVTVPPNCPEGQVLVNGVCRDIWRTRVNFQTYVNGNPESHNVVVVPPNCPPGQTLVNGVCRDIWSAGIKPQMYFSEYVDNQNVVVVPPNCPPGYVLVNGVCREEWNRESKTTHFSEYADNKNVVVVPPNCPPGYVLVNGVCREEWNFALDIKFPTFKLECPLGYALIAGLCIDQRRNVITVPNNCPEGQVWFNGACRDVWRALDVKVSPETR
ncbi:uncharacterized protein LOC106139121 isoform X1 [Amyelois transitella]|uniref:uncharacterized protein LOC106139121 isoform X1 n=1 Tax=Amyelois transitella TaxID=680683 RepID=UPI00298F5141|nr:uncharacterized protein LOC106139121 isoform X1 [Amyelois transitella]